MEQVINVYVPSDESIVRQLTLTADFNKFVGELVNFPKAQSFTFLDHEVKVPGVSATNDQSLRTFAVLMAMNAAIFGDADVDKIHEEGTLQHLWYDAVKSVKVYGIPSHASKNAVSTAFKAWRALKKNRMEGQKNATLLLNEKMVAQTKVLKEFNAQAKKLLTAAVDKSEKEYRALLAEKTA